MIECCQCFFKQLFNISVKKDVTGLHCNAKSFKIELMFICRFCVFVLKSSFNN